MINRNTKVSNSTISANEQVGSNGVIKKLKYNRCAKRIITTENVVYVSKIEKI